MRCECGEPIEPGQKFCIVCGRKIADGAVPDEGASLVRNMVDQAETAPDDDTVVLDDLPSVSDESSDETMILRFHLTNRERNVPGTKRSSRSLWCWRWSWPAL